MPSHEIEPDGPVIPIDHPAQPGWLSDSNAAFDERTGRYVEAITERYQGPEAGLHRLLADVALAGAIVVSNRMNHEAVSRGILGINGEDTPARSAYAEYAGRPEHIGRFVRWFGEVAQACFERTDIHPDIKKIGLDLGGIRQAGRWAGTKPIDMMATDTLKEKLLEIDENIEVEIFGKSKAMKKNYTVQPLGAITDEGYNPDFANVLVRRRRGVANISISGRYPLHVIKEAWVVECLDLIDEKEAAIIRKDFRTYEDYQTNTEKAVRNKTSSAGAGGRVSEDAIDRKAENPPGVTPVSAHYYIVMHGPKSKVYLSQPVSGI